MGDDELVIDFEEIIRAKARQENPHLKEYHNKLKELMQSEINSKDNFINWITGISSGALLFIFAQNKQIIDTKKMVLWAGMALFLAIISGILFKMFLSVSYGQLRLEVKLLRILWEGHEFRRDVIEEKKDMGEVCKKTEEKLKRNLKESAKALDPKHKEKTVMWSFIGYKLLDIFYLLTIALFILGFICMGTWYFT